MNFFLHLQPVKWLWCWEGLGAGGKGEDRGWDGWMASWTQWAWVWVNSGSWWWTGMPGMLQSMGLQRVGHNWVTELNLIFHYLNFWQLLICSLFSTEEHLCCIQILAIMNKASVNICVQALSVNLNFPLIWINSKKHDCWKIWQFLLLHIFTNI